IPMEGVDLNYGEPGAIQSLFGLCADSKSKHEQTLHRVSSYQRREALRSQWPRGEAEYSKRVCSRDKGMEGRGHHRAGVTDGAPARSRRSTHQGRHWRCSPEIWPARLQRGEGGQSEHTSEAKYCSASDEVAT